MCRDGKLQKTKSGNKKNPTNGGFTVWERARTNASQKRRPQQVVATRRTNKKKREAQEKAGESEKFYNFKRQSTRDWSAQKQRRFQNTHAHFHVRRVRYGNIALQMRCSVCIAPTTTYTIASIRLKLAKCSSIHMRCNCSYTKNSPSNTWHNTHTSSGHFLNFPLTNPYAYVCFVRGSNKKS